MHEAVRDGKKILVEGANAAMLDIDFGKFLDRMFWDVLWMLWDVF